MFTNPALISSTLAEYEERELRRRLERRRIERELIAERAEDGWLARLMKYFRSAELTHRRPVRNPSVQNQPAQNQPVQSPCKGMAVGH